MTKNIGKYPIEKMCECMKVSKNAYYNWLQTNDLNKMKPSKIILKNRIKMIFEESSEIYRSCRIQKQFKRKNLIYSRSYIGLLMKEMGLRSVLKKEICKSTDSKYSYPITKNELNRYFFSSKLSEK